MSRSRQDAVIAILAIALGLVIGGLLAVMTRLREGAGTNVATVSTTAPSPASSTPHGIAKAEPVTTGSSPRSTAAAPTGAPANSRGADRAWQIVETHTSVGTILWTGVGRFGGDGLALDVRKAQVRGHEVGPCERDTHLRATVSVSARTAPYRETNCSGATSAGDMRISWRSSDGHTLSGSFWKDGAKLGDFKATAP